MADWLTITTVTYGQRRKDVGLVTSLQDVTYVDYEVEDEPGMRFRAAFDGNLPNDIELLRKTERRYLIKAQRVRKRLDS